MKKIYKEYENRICFAVFIITMFIAISPLISRYCINGHDLEYHLLRIESLKEGILIGKPFLKVNTLFFGGAGYASSMFYSDLFLYIPALLRVMGLSIGASYHFFVGFIFVIGYISTFYCTYKMTDSKYMASIAAVLFTLCPYHMDDMLVRGACGEYMAFVFVPFVVYGVYNAIFEEMDKPYIFGIGFAGLILSHPATLVFNVGFAFVAFLIFIKKIISNKKIVIRLFIVTVITLLITSFQWLPMLEQMMSSKFYVSLDTIDMLDASIGFSEIFASAFPTVGTLLFVCIIPRIFLNKNENKILSYVDVMIVMGILFAIAATNVMPWEYLGRFLRFVQFPWRLFIMSSVLLSISSAIVLTLFVEKITQEKHDLLLLIVLAISIPLAVNHESENATGYYDYANDYYSYKPYTANVIGGEWLPVAVSNREEIIPLSEHMIDANNNDIPFERNRAVVTAVVGNTEYVDVPFIYYKGYTANLTDEANNVQKLKITGDGINGMCRVYTDEVAGTLQVSYKGTTATHASIIISLLTLICLILMMIRNSKSRAGKIIFRNSIIVFLVCGSMFISGCTSADINRAARQINELSEAINKNTNNDFKNPDNVVGYLQNKEVEEEPVEEEIEEIVEPVINVSCEGYDSNGSQFAVVLIEDENGENYSFTSLDDAKENGAQVIITDNLYGKLAEEYIDRLIVYYDNKMTDSGEIPLNINELKTALMQQADILLYLDYHPEDSNDERIRKLANRLGYLIYESSDVSADDIVLNYNCAAVLSSMVTKLEDFEAKDEAQELAVRLWDEAESINSEDGVSEINRAWAAAELFKSTGNKTYRTIVEAISQDIELSGVSYDAPGYYCVFAYLSTESSTNYDISSRMMDHFFADINARIKNTKEDILKASIDSMSEGVLSKEFVNTLTDDCTVAMMADYISMSVEYTRYTQDRIIFLSGANPQGMDYFSDENINVYDPLLFALCSLER